MAPGRQQPRAWRKETDAGSRSFSVTSSEDVPVSGANGTRSPQRWTLFKQFKVLFKDSRVVLIIVLLYAVPFEELLARELRQSEGNSANAAVKSGGKAAKKPFLKRGARGWWMRQPGAKLKVVKHTLVSKGEEEEAASKAVPVTQRKLQQQQQQRRRRRSSSASSSKTLSPVETPPDQVRTAAVPSQTLSPSASPTRGTHYNNQVDNDDDEVVQRRHRNDEFAAWKNASFRSTTSTDVMGMKNVRQSYEAKQEREASEMAEFEAIERDLAAEKEAFLMEKQQQQYHSSGRVGQWDQVNDNQTDHWGLPYSSFVSELHEQDHSRWTTGKSGSIFDDSLDEEADSALVFDDHSALSTDDWVSGGDGFTNQLRDHFGYGNNYGDPPSDLSAVSFDDSVPWDDGLSFQPEPSSAHERFSIVGAASVSLNPGNERNGSLDDEMSKAPRQQAARRGVYFADHDDDNSDTLGYNMPDTLNRIPEGDAPVSSLVQHVFGGIEQGEGSNNDILSYEDDLDSIDAGSGRSKINLAPSAPSPPPPPPPVQDKSLSTLKQKLRGKQKPPVSRVSANKAKGTGPAKAKPAASSRAPAKQKPGASSDKQMQPRGRVTQPANSGMILPAVIEEKLYELEEEVKFYKSETLQLQKRKDYYDQEVKKLALERDEFARYQQEQRVLIEKEWERERAKMKKETKLQERQWKLRMNATISHQDRKDRGEVEMLKAQIVKLQLDEKAHASKWKAGNDNLRHRVAELEEKNLELSDEIKFLEKDRLEQWGKYEQKLKEKQEAPSRVSKSEVASAAPTVFREKSELRTIDDVFAIKGAADELLQRWSSPQKNDQPFTVRSGYHHRVQPNAVDAYNPKRYSLEREGSQPSSDHGDFTDGSGLESTHENGFTSNSDYVSPSSAAATYEWALPDAEDDEALPNIGYGDRKSGDGHADVAVSASTSSLSERKILTEEIEHPGGKKELLYADRSKKIIFPDGNEKDIDANGHVVIKFTNGDHKEASQSVVFPDSGISVYYYHEAQTKLTTYPDNRKVYEFPNQQIETSLPDGTTEIQFADGIKKTIRPNGDEFSVFPDGTTMLEQPDGLREVTLLNQKKIRYFPDGQMACVTPSGQETRVRSDSELQQLMEST
ncbi:Sphingosine kinase 2 [Phytophthora pseudosyringae]|uniref:Sphingosine kinase 2 n=1 Tax=Phytophthora pseudosyringae TaxID=221518 RepID=A0A8T1VFR8_9STRA|nr:Sphingosine kinase 2 [Phytophthora pseudosyringae]